MAKGTSPGAGRHTVGTPAPGRRIAIFKNGFTHSQIKKVLVGGLKGCDTMESEQEIFLKKVGTSF